MKTLHLQTVISSKKIFELERCGKYEEALAELRDIWQDTTTLPNVENYDARSAAEIILRCGSLIGFLGHNKQIPNAQEKSKNLLTEAHHRFLDIYNVEKIAECENYLALAYWRTGEAREAEVWIEESLSHNLPNSNEIRLYANIIKCLVLLSIKKYEEIISNLSNLEDDFLNCSDYCLKGDFYNNFAIALKNLGRTKEALSKFEVARYYHQKSHHKIYLGTIENNLAQLYKFENLFTKAHQAIDRGTKIFKQIKDRTREGFSLDTKSQIYFAERKYTQALKTVEKAICILKKSENLAYLVETSLTKSKILLYLDDFTAATLSLFEAVQIARVNTGEEAARDLIKEFEKTLLEKNKIADENLFEEDQSDIDNLKLILPSSISHYTEIQGVWIKNSHLENVGLRKNSLAIVAQTEIKRGDLSAISEIETGAIFCGVYDCDFGIVCLEGANGEPQLFDEKSIKILGKIVGVCNSGKDTDGKMIVQPINL
jgi:tetratricopeptide (TPR) repeat protein